MMKNRKVVVPANKGGMDKVFLRAIMMSSQARLLDDYDKLIVHSYWEVGTDVELAIELQRHDFWGAVDEVRLMNITI
jgi:hypothetical protein